MNNLQHQCAFKKGNVLVFEKSQSWPTLSLCVFVSLLTHFVIAETLKKIDLNQKEYNAVTKVTMFSNTVKQQKQVALKKAILPAPSIPSVPSLPPPQPPQTHLDQQRNWSLKELFPAASVATKSRQRDWAIPSVGGADHGAEPVAGDLQSEQESTVDDPRRLLSLEQKPRFEKQEHTYFAYVEGLSSRFAEVWGPQRFLSPLLFQGIVGEVIEYDIGIHRGGSLAFVKNITAQQQPNRDFSAVDKLVSDVLGGVFPYNPLPERIQKIPLVIRKAIRYMGQRYSLF